MNVKTSFFAASDVEADDNSLFVKQDKFKEHGYARCGNRIYKVIRMTKEGTPVFRKYGEVIKVPTYGSAVLSYQFKHASKPKGIYARDKDGAVQPAGKNYTPCKRGPWWAGTVVRKA